MRIGIDVRLWSETGVGRYIRNLVKKLQILDKNNQYVLFVRSQNYSDINSKIAATNFKLIKADIHWHSIAEQIIFPNLLNKENLDLMHFPYFSLPIFYSRPFVVTVHDLIINHFPTGKASTLPYPMYIVKRFGYDFVIKNAVKNATKIIVPLHVVKDDLVQTLGVQANKIMVTYEGASLKLKGKEEIGKNASPFFLYVGNAYPHKNLEFLINAFTKFKKDIKKDMHLVLVGENDFFYKRLSELVEKEKISGIIFRHDVGDEELALLYSQATAYVSASLMEGFGLPPLEAMAANCSVLLSDIPSFREVCRDAAFYFDPRELSSLTQNLTLVYNLDPKTKEKHLTNGLERTKDFSWEKMAKETKEIYESCFSL